MTHNKQIHFLNGYFDFTDGELKQRTDKFFINRNISIEIIKNTSKKIK